MAMKKILIVDYDQSSLASLQGVLAGRGYQVVTAADGQTGWDKYNKESPDLVLMEAMLPKVHGFELCQRITSERNSQATVFIMTGVYKDRVYRTEALRTYGASEYFEKPLKMAELLASVEAVLGRPEPKPAEEMPAAEAPAPAAPVLEMRAEAAPAQPRKREKAQSDDSMFALPDDLDRLSREMPKVRKPAPARTEPAPEPRLDAVADELLKSVIVESKTPKPLHGKPAGGNGNGNGNGKAEIDQFLATALAGLDLNKEKVKVPKPVPAPAPAPAPPVQETPVAKPTPAATLEPKPTPPPPPVPEPVFSAPANADMKNTLVPGDPGSDVSPFFTPDKFKREAPVERPQIHQAPHPPAPPAAAPKPARPVEKAVKAEPAKPPAHQEPAKPAPARHEAKKAEGKEIPHDIFKDFHETKAKPAFPKFIAVGIVVVVLAAAGFILLRPKKAAPVPAATEPAPIVTQSPSNAPSEPVAEPAVKPAPAKPKPQPQAQPKTKPANPDTAGADAILPVETASAALPLLGAPSASGPANGQGTGSPNAQQGKTDEGASPAGRTEEPKTQPAAADPGTSSDPGTVTVAPPPEASPVKEGDLVELSAVTEPPKLVKSSEPVYPMTAHRLGIGGSITVNALIDEKGNVIDTGILKGIQDDKGLGRAAETAVKKWKFQPARKNGVAVKVWKPFVIAFKADVNPANRMD
jgi:TonB family protein